MENTSLPVGVRPRPRPAAVASFIPSEPTGIELTDGVFWAAFAKRRVLGKMSWVGGGKVHAYAKADAGFTDLGVYPDHGAASSAIRAVNPLFDPEKEAESQRKRRTRTKK